MTGYGKAKTWAAGILALGITLYTAWKLLITGMLAWHIEQTESLEMLLEFLVVWLFLAFLFFYGRNWRGVNIRIAVLGAMLAWLHAVFLPVILAGLYVGYLVLGGWLAGRLFLKRKLSIPWAFTFGSAITVSIFCLMSLVHHGSINQMRLWALGSGAALLLWYRLKGSWQTTCSFGAGPRQPRIAPLWQHHGRPDGQRCLRPAEALALASIGALLFLQMSRMNVAIDYDSIWYGVRSHLMLDSGNSIYENLGTLGIVYTYPKGWEVLTLPLAGLPSYSFLIAFNWWTAVLVLLAGYEAACVRMEQKGALWVPCFMAAVPGIMNMACTTKTDLITLLFQLLLIHSMLQYEKERRTDWLVLGISSAIFSLTMKPTAVIYSAAEAGIAFIWLLWDHYSNKKNLIAARSSQAADLRIWLALIPSLSALAGIWGRTLKLVGVPVTSIFYGLFKKLGFTVKYPFYATAFPATAKGMKLWEKVCFFGRRLCGVLINPQGDDMAHVVISWGTALPLILLIVWLCMKTWKKKEKRKTPQYLTMLTAGMVMIDLVSLYYLSQVDGNYYMLTYALLILDFCLWGEEMQSVQRRASRLVLLPSWFLAVLLCSLTNWSWTLGNGGIHLKNPGYYNHVQAAREEMTKQGSGEIWKILASNPKNRAIALGEVPDVLTFPCCVESYIDVSNYWGNPKIVSDASDFLQYLQYANMDYLYMEKKYVKKSMRIYGIIRELIRTGCLYDVRDENGNLILRVNKGSPEPLEIPRNLEVFDTRYRQYP